MNTNNQAIVINDLLSFISCKIKVTSRDKLLRSLREYYSEDVILNAQKVLLESLPVKKSTRHGRRVKHPDPLVAMYDCFQLIPSEDLPIFVCRNLNNVPQLDIIKMEMLDERELVIEEEYENSHQDIKYEQIAMKSQIADITDVVKQIKDQLKHIVQQQPSPVKSTKFDKFTNINRPNTALKRRKLSANSSSSSKFSKKLHMPTQIKERPMPNSRKSPKKTMAYIQQLIDEEAEMKNDSQYEEKDEDSDYIGDISDDEEKVVQNACEVVLKEGLEEGIIQSHRLRGTPVKIPGEKIIYIKNEEEDYGYDYDELRMDEENSIEISSADHYPSFDDIDSFSRAEIKIFEEEHLEGGIETHTVNEEVALDPICPECGIKFDSLQCLSEHMKNHDIRKLFECVLCSIKLHSKAILRQHYTECVEVTKEKYSLANNRCPIPSCGSLFAKEKALNQHLSVHSDSRQFRCNICEYRYLTQTALVMHVKTQHNPLNKFNCPFCYSSHISYTSLKHHIRSHTGDRPFECKDCSYKAATNSLLQRHMLRHSSPKPYICDVCNQEFIGNAKLSRHKIKEHKKENIVCRKCSKVFTNSCVYNKHYMTHTRERPYECSYCRYAAISKEVLMVHLKTHEGADPFLCPQCNIPISTKYALKRHLRAYCVHNDTFSVDCSENIISFEVVC